MGPDSDTERPRRIFLVEDHPVVRKGLRLLLEEQDDLRVVGEASGIAETQRLLPALNAELAIVDLSLQDGDGLDLLDWISRRLPDCRCLVSSMFDEEFFIGPALEAGALGYVKKTADEKHLLEAVRSVLAGKIVMDEQLASRFIHRKNGENGERAGTKLTRREAQVFRMLGEGLGPKEIGSQLNVSVKTVEAYQARLRAKLGLSSTLEVRRRATLWILGRNEDDSQSESG